MGESKANHARIEYRLRRGMLELDALLRRFYQAEIANLDEQQLHVFAQLLELEDPTLYQMLIGVTDPELPDQLALVEGIRRYSHHL